LDEISKPVVVALLGGGPWSSWGWSSALRSRRSTFRGHRAKPPRIAG